MLSHIVIRNNCHLSPNFLINIAYSDLNIRQFKAVPSFNFVVIAFRDSFLDVCLEMHLIQIQIRSLDGVQTESRFLKLPKTHNTRTPSNFPYVFDFLSLPRDTFIIFEIVRVHKRDIYSDLHGIIIYITKIKTKIYPK